MAEAQAGTEGNKPPEGQQQQQQPVGAQGGAPQQQQPQGGTPKPPEGQQPATQEKKRHSVGADGDIPKDADLLEMTPRALKGRLERATRAELKERFGTDDVDQIKKDLDELKEFREAKEKKRQSEMSELEKEKELRLKAEKDRDTAQQAAQQAREDREYDKQDRRITRVAAKHIDPDYVEAELTGFAAHLLENFSKKELRKMGDDALAKEAEEFFKKRVETKPKLAKDYEDRRREELKKELKDEASGKTPKKPVDNGGKQTGSQGAAARPSGEPKTHAPGKSNSYTKEESDQILRKENGGRLPWH